MTGSEDTVRHEALTRRDALRTAGMLAAGAIAGAAAGVFADVAPAAADSTAVYDSSTPIPAVTANSSASGAGRAISIQTDGIGVAIDGHAISSRAIDAISIVSGDGNALRSTSNANGLLSTTTSTNALDSAIWANSTGAATGLSVGSNSGRGLVVRTSGVAALHLPASNAAPPTRVGPAFQTGDIELDSDGTMWICIADGSPGTWRRLGGSNTAGTYTAVTPTRVYDSRAAQPSPGALPNASNRTISVADGRDNSGAVITIDLVPAGATAIAANVTVTNTVGINNICVNPGGITTRSASTINWFATGQTLANGATLAISTARTVTLVSGAQGGSADVIVDVTGYWR